MSINEQLFQTICGQAREAALLHSAADTLEWDERTRMPPAAGDYRAQQVSALRAAVHRLKTDSQFAEDLQTAIDQLGDEDPHSDAASTIRMLHRDWQRDRKLPTELVERVAGTTVRGQQFWDHARRQNDFSLFRDVLDEVIDLKQEVGQRIAAGSERTTYEALMDEYEPDASEQQIQAVFDAVRGPLVELISQIRASSRRPDPEVLKREYPIAAQRRFSENVAQRIGFDFQRGRLDETSHPFCTTLGPHDCRILTRYDLHWLPSGLFGTLHEAGHGLYEQGLRTDWFGLPPGSYTSLGIHESQSRLWENQVGRSKAFWSYLYPNAQKSFTPNLDDVALADFYFAVNCVQPSLIRVEADEATYNLHILIRFDLEKQLIDGSLSADDLPEAWNDRYERDLGIRPPSDADGVLQDVHWSAGLFGYFPTYTLGNLVSAQLFDAAGKQIGDLQAAISEGDFQPLRQWLIENVHRYGRCYSGEELVRRATGGSLSADQLIKYLRDKLQPLYGITE